MFRLGCRGGWFDYLAAHLIIGGNLYLNLIFSGVIWHCTLTLSCFKAILLSRFDLFPLSSCPAFIFSCFNIVPLSYFRFNVILFDVLLRRCPSMSYFAKL